LGERFASATILVFVFVWIVCASAIADAASNKFEPTNLEGSWFVLVHYKDSATSNHDSDRWLDKVWTFKHKGSRLTWVEYPIVVLESSSGRFESYKGNARSRILAKWEPNEAQLAELMEGPRVNTRGSKSKSLRGTDARGWKSAGRNRVAGVNMMGFHENWSIGTDTENRTFTIAEVLGNDARGNSEGKTTYTTVSTNADGSEYAGTFDRDGTRIGSFRMFRTAKIRPLKSSQEDDSVNKRRSKQSFEDLMRQSK
jgi:hypothetical protein